MGFLWQAEMKDKSVVSERQTKWKDVNIHDIEVLKLISTTVPKRIVTIRKPVTDFVEFIHFKTAMGAFRMSGPMNAIVESYCIGYTDGYKEYYTRVYDKSMEVVFETLDRRMHFHPKSIR